MSNGKIAISNQGGFFSVADAEVLVVLLHGYTLTSKSLQRVAEIVREEYERSDIYAPRLPLHLFSLADPDEIALAIMAYLARLPKINAYRSIILVGHSFGAVLARSVWALVHGATPAAAVDPGRAQKWANNIDRIVLLAAMSRGWMVSSALDPLARLSWTLGAAWGSVCRSLFGREPVAFGIRRGAPFLTTVRLQCVAVTAALQDRLPITVQLLGTADDYVAPTDNLDLATGRDFYYVEVAEATHLGIVRLDEGDGSAGALARFRLALKIDRQGLKEISLTKEDVFDLYDEALDDHDAMVLPQRNLDVRHVVFVVHGIRDRGFWTRRIAREVKLLARQAGEPCRTVTSTYGYFPMGPFLLPWMRRNKVEWLLDQYVTAKSLYPRAKFSYIGHSNGTYLLANALEICPAVNFERVVFAGSVVRSSFDWSGLIPGRVASIVNYVATADNVVAIFPQCLERLRLQDLGGAGHDGFADRVANNIRYVKGGHGAALASARWREMADFVLTGTPPPNPVPAPARNRATVWMGRVAPAIWLALAIMIIGIGTLLLAPLGATGWIFALVFAGYLYLLSVVLTRA